MGLSESKSVKGRNQDGIPFVIWNETYHFAEPSSYIYESTKRQVHDYAYIHSMRPRHDESTIHE